MTSINYFVTCLLIIFSLSFSNAQNVYFYNQAQVDSFDQNITNIAGDLEIKGNISDLSNLSSLTSINGSLEITFTSSLLNLDDFSELLYLGKSLTIEHNIQLSNIDGLSNLADSSIANYNISICCNDEIKNIAGLSSLTTVKAINIYANPLLDNVDGLESITTIDSSLLLQNNNSIKNVDGFSNITSIGAKMKITENSSLTNCCGIQNILTLPNAIGDSIIIFGNPFECNSEEEIINTNCSLSNNTVINNNNNFYLYPNPVQSELNISFNKVQEKNKKIVVYDLRGNILSINSLFIDNNENYTVDISEIPSGLYFLHTEIDGIGMVEKFVKE